MLLGLVAPLVAAPELPPLKTRSDGPPLKVACVGDSITQGSGTTGGQNYPRQLQEILGSEWQVGNFGVSGRTLLRKGDFPYWAEGAYQKALAFKPDAVIIMLGTNDTKPQNWSHQEDFEKDYSDLVKSFQELKPTPRIYICRPVPVPDPGNFGINEAGLQQQMPMLDRVAESLKTGIIDMHAALDGKPEMLPDRVHPNNQGAGEMAKVAFTALTGMRPDQVTLPNSLFRDGAVLQRGVELPVWGTAPDGTAVTVQFAGQTATANASEGRWSVVLKPLSASAEPQVMKVTGTTTTMVNNLLVGEVWVASGQSNMERQLGPRNGQKEIVGWKEAAAAARFPLIREYAEPHQFKDEASADGKGHWVVCSPETAANFSAVGFFFARELQPSIKVPIGIIHSSWGGTRVEAWMDPGSLKECSVKVNPVKNQNSPGGLYQGMIAPLVRYPIKGVIWYQGESNRTNPGDYQQRFTSMIAGWRRDWNAPEMPFLFVQIAPHKSIPPEIRQAQLQTLRAVPATGMAVLTDIGDADDIHPTRKEPVGARLALAARAIAYGEKVEWSGPLYQSIEVSAGKAAVSFTHTGGGLVAKDGALRGFTIAGTDGNFVPAVAEIQGDRVLVSSDQVADPKSVRYGWENVPDVNLFNKEGLPASPFRSDSN